MRPYTDTDYVSLTDLSVEMLYLAIQLPRANPGSRVNYPSWSGLLESSGSSVLSRPSVSSLPVSSSSDLYSSDGGATLTTT